LGDERLGGAEDEPEGDKDLDQDRCSGGFGSSWLRFRGSRSSAEAWSPVLRISREK
jgi:hypothetical protein